MRNRLAIGAILAATQVLGMTMAIAGPWEDGMAAYNRSDYVPAIQIFRPLARAGNHEAQKMLGMMYRRGQGVVRSSAHAAMWLTLASHRGNSRADRELRKVMKTMTPQELGQVQAMTQSCEASNFTYCE